MSEIFNQYNNELMNNKQGVKIVEKIIANNMRNLDDTLNINIENIKLTNQPNSNQNSLLTIAV